MRPPTRWEALRRWFNNSGMIPLYRCEHCGGMAAGGAVLYRSVRPSGPARVFRLPIDVLAALRRERTWQPVPRFYAFVLGFALVPAGLLAVATGVRRWLIGVPAAAWAVAFGWSMTTAFTSGRAGQVVLGVVAPRRASRRRLDRELAVARRALAMMPAVAPVAWAGEVSIGGVGYSESRHGEPQPHELSIIADQDGSLMSSPRLVIRVSVGGDPTEDDVQLLRGFVESELDLDAFDRSEVEAGIEARREAVERLVEQRLQHLRETWRPTVVHVDGGSVPALAVTAGGSTLVCFDLAGHRVTVTASGFEGSGLALERVHDPEPLIAALERRRRDPLAGAHARPA